MKFFWPALWIRSGWVILELPHRFIMSMNQFDQNSAFYMKADIIKCLRHCSRNMLRFNIKEVVIDLSISIRAFHFSSSKLILYGWKWKAYTRIRLVIIFVTFSHFCLNMKGLRPLRFFGGVSFSVRHLIGQRCLGSSSLVNGYLWSRLSLEYYRTASFQGNSHFILLTKRSCCLQIW